MKPTADLNEAESRKHRIGHRIRDGLASRWLPAFAVLAGVLLSLTSITTGFQADDFFQREVLLGSTASWVNGSPYTGMFAFLNGDKEETLQRMNGGGVPWWTWPELRVSFFRPLAALTHVIDYRLWPDSPITMHVHSVVWYALLVWLAAVLFRATSSPMWVAGLAALLYAVDDSHGLSVGWIANRNALVSAVLGVGTLILHIRWRETAWRPGAYLAPFCLFAGLLGGEAAVATGAYLLAYELTLGRGPALRRALGLVPYLLVGAAWWGWYQSTGLGVSGSAAYLEPLREPLRFTRAAIEHIPILLQGLWSAFVSGCWSAMPTPHAQLLWIWAVVFALVLAALLYPVVCHEPIARFWTLGMLLSLVPACATFPANRLLLFASLGAMGLLAQFLAGCSGRAHWVPSSQPRRFLTLLVAVVLFITHAILAPILLPANSTGLARVNDHFTEHAVVSLVNRPENVGKTLFLLNAPSAALATVGFYTRTELANSLPDRCHLLSSGLHLHINVTRVDSRTLDIEPHDGFASARIDRLFRDSGHPMQPGECVHLEDFVVTVMSTTPDGRPLRARFTFTQPVDSPSYLFAQASGTGLVEFEAPAIGESVEIPFVLLPRS